MSVGETCHTHPDRDATATCGACARAICDGCTARRGARVLCSSCAFAERQRRHERNARVLAGVVLVAGAALVLLLTRFVQPAETGAARGQPTPSVDHGRMAPTIRKLRAEMGREPCDRQKIIQLGEALIQGGDPRGALDEASAFWQRCGAHPRLLWVTHAAHARLSEHAAALADVDQLIAADPDNKDFHVWRGHVQEAAQNVDGAIADFEKALHLSPRLQQIPLNVAALYERTGRTCEALMAVEEYLIHYPDLRTSDGIRQRLARLDRAGGCGQRAGTGRARLKVSSDASRVMCSPRIDGKAAGSFIVDTAASVVVLSRRVADRLGLVAAQPGIRVATAGGIRTVYPVVLDRVEVQGAVAPHVVAAISDELPAGIDGLLGLSFLKHFEVHMDAQAGFLEMVSRAPVAPQGDGGEQPSP